MYLIRVKLSDDEFEYDIRSLIRAFYPVDTLYVECENRHENTKKQRFLKEYEDMPVRFDLEVFFRNDAKVEVVLSDSGKTLQRTRQSHETNRSIRKNDLKIALYELFCQYTGKSLSWGTLTGIRPTKLITAGLKQGLDKESIKKQMQEKYCISGEKFEVGYEIAREELRILGPIFETQKSGKRGYNLYVGIPFCPTRCLYCSFTAYPAAGYEKKMDFYVEAIKKELLTVAQEMKEDVLHTVYFGGGTPTTLSAKQLEEIITFIKEQFDCSNLVEFTVEAGRPDSITVEKLETLKKLGVDRISINPQTMKQETLDLIGRRHTVTQIREAFCQARECGFDNINMDMIVGLPNETPQDVKDSLKEIKELGPDSLTVHSLAIKHNSRLNLNWEDYQYMAMENSDEMMNEIRREVKEQGLVPYYMYRQKAMAGNQENVGYAKEGKACLYNILIMEEMESILAVGAGAITKLVKEQGNLFERVENVKDIDSYLARVDEMCERKKAAIGRMKQ